MTADPGEARIPVAASPGAGQDPVLDIRDLSVVYRTPGGDVRAGAVVDAQAPDLEQGLAGLVGVHCAPPPRELPALRFSPTGPL